MTGNDGCIVLTDLTLGVPGDESALRRSTDRFVEELVVTRPAAWLRKQHAPKLVVYAHGGLNGEPEAIDRVRVLAPYFEANGIYPLFVAWRTGRSRRWGRCSRTCSAPSSGPTTKSRCARPASSTTSRRAATGASSRSPTAR